jgi:5-methylcytosine-specific restriction endonuclease McrA
MQIILRAQAKAQALKQYYTGLPCKAGHLSPKLTVNGACVECSRLRQLAKYASNREENLRKQKIRRDSDPNLSDKKKASRLRRDIGYAERMALWHDDSAARTAAKAAGLIKYVTTRRCSLRHIGERFTSDGKCVECNRISCGIRYAKKAQDNPSIMEFRRTSEQRAILSRQKSEAYAIKAGPWREVHKARQLAIANKSLTYAGRQCVNGHDGLRYTKGGGCVNCYAELAASPEKKAYDRLYFTTNSDRIRRRTKLYYARTSEQRAVATKRWAEANREKVRVIKDAYKSRRRAKEKAGDPTAKIYAWKISAIKKCYWCGVWCRNRYHVDHYEPLSKGGLHVVTNLVIACPRCNQKKSAKDPYEFAASVGRLF